MVVFKHWIESHWHDWQDNDVLVEEFKKFIQKTVIASGLQKSADILTHLLARKVELFASAFMWWLSFTF